MHIMQWLQKDFLGYFRDWEETVCCRKGYSKDEQNRMMLSRETLYGIRMTGYSWDQFY